MVAGRLSVLRWVCGFDRYSRASVVPRCGFTALRGLRLNSVWKNDKTTSLVKMMCLKRKVLFLSQGHDLNNPKTLFISPFISSEETNSTFY